MYNNEIRAKRFGSNLEVEVTVYDGSNVLFVHVSDAEGMIYSVTDKSIFDENFDSDDFKIETVALFSTLKEAKNSEYGSAFKLAKKVYDEL